PQRLRVYASRGSWRAWRVRGKLCVEEEEEAQQKCTSEALKSLVSRSQHQQRSRVSIITSAHHIPHHHVLSVGSIPRYAIGGHAGYTSTSYSPALCVCMRFPSCSNRPVEGCKNNFSTK
ncbi:hypothetical protein TcCL_ESM00069, partial [Trypanosoma cruzi]